MGLGCFYIDPSFFLLCVQSEMSLIFSSIASNFLLIPPSKTSISDSIKESLYNYGFKNVNITRAGGTITSHCGEECLGVLYINDGGVN